MGRAFATALVQYTFRRVSVNMINKFLGQETPGYHPLLARLSILFLTFSLNLPKSKSAFHLLFHCEYCMQITTTGLTRIRPQNNRVIVIRSEAASIFSRELNRQEEKILDVDNLELEDLKEELHDVGDDFEKEPTLANFRVFRELIGKFAKKATSMAYRIEKKAIYRSTRTLEIVAIIDRAADELYHLVMEGQQNRIRIAGRIANINGMIIQISV